MQKLVLDTDIVVDYLRTGSGVIVEAVELQNDDKAEIYVSTITILELVSGRTGDQDIEKVKEFLRSFNIVVLHGELAEFVGRKRRELPKSLSLSDLIIGGTALWLGAKLVTRNKKHFEQIPGLKFWRTVD